MLKRPLSLLLAGAVLASLGACSTPSERVEHAMYWQKKSTSEALYMRGPKAQQQLNTDISRCVAELKELYHLGAIRHAIPGEDTIYNETPDPDDPAGTLAEWESPDRNGSMRNEHLDYHDFEGCMEYKGWERIKHVPYNVAKESERVYYKTIYGEDERYDSHRPSFRFKNSGGDYSDLNE